MKAITLKEAEKFDIKKYNSDLAIKRDKEDLIYIESINSIICTRLDDIKKGPISVSFGPVCLDKIERLKEKYTDFTLSYSSWSPSLSIKLSDKDWDWKGYGIKELPHKIIIKKNWFQKLFNL